MDRGGKG
jgi:heme-degrading monooxygenase HmoA